MGDSFEITPREIAFGVIILLVMLALGFYISSVILNKVQESNEKYYTALKIDNDQEAFQYALRTSVGKTMVYGEVKSVDPVRFPELLCDYFYVEKVRERYTEHTRVVTETHTDSKGNTYTTSHTEIYYTWDYAGKDWFCSTKFNFLGVEFPIEKISLPGSGTISLDESTYSSEYLGDVSWNYYYPSGKFWDFIGEIRYHYNGVPKSFNTTMFMDIKDKTFTGVGSSKPEMFFNTKIQQAIEEIQGRETFYKVLFWVIYSLVMIAALVGFFYLQNNWLEDKKKVADFPDYDHY